MKREASRSRSVILILSVLCVAVAIACVMSFAASADTAELPGRTFASNDLYKLNEEIKPDGSITFETEIYIPEKYRNNRGILISSYNGGKYLGGFAFEVGSSAAGCEGKIRVFSQTYGNVVINHKITDYMGTDADPKFVKIAVTVDTTSKENNIVLYVNGEKKATATNASVTSTMYNSTQTINGSTQTNNLSIGNDERLSLPFLGTMKNVALYKGVRDAQTVAKDHSGAFYDTADSNLIFALDGTAEHDRFIEDKSANSNHAINKNYKLDPGKNFASTATTELYKTSKNITPNGSITFEAEIYVPEAQRSQRTGAIISNYDGGTNKESWAFEIMAGGNVRVFSQSHGDINPINHSVTQYMGTDANPQYAKIAVTVNTTTGEAVLYVNGIARASGKNSASTRTVNMYNTTSPVWIGGDGRPGNAQNFKGYIRSVAIYKGIRTEAQIALDNARSFYDTTDPTLLFAHDLTLQHDGFIEDRSANRNHANNSKWTTAEGMAFSSANEPLYAAKDYTQAPLTYEALIYAPTSIDRTGVIWGNYPNANGNCLNFEIYSGGKPSIYIYENGALRTNYKFNYDVRRNAWVHVAVTMETVYNTETKVNDTVFKCYVDGELVDTYTQANYVYELDMAEIQLTGPISIGRDVRDVQVYKGRIKNVVLHNRPLSAEEIKANAENGTSATAESIIAYYDMTSPSASTDKIADASGNGYDMQKLFYEKDFETEDYDYSFAIVGDTQFLVYQDAVNGTNYTEYIYDYIVNNRVSKNIKYVIGLGDIIDNGKYADGTSSKAAEWAYAKDLIVSKLGTNNIPYSLIGGNHDYMRPWDTGFNASFANESTLTDNITGYYENGSIYNYYMNFEVEGTPYMLLALEYGANDDILAWANNVIASNAQRSVIITTHGYMNRDGTTLDENDYAAPRPAGSTDANTLKYNNGDDMWEKMVRKHANIIMVLSGHIDYNNIVMREDVGDHGNVVRQFLIDPQAMDKTYGYETGMVAMFYFRNGGKDVSVEYVSTYKSAKNGNKEVLFNGRNQLEFTIKGAPAAENKGEINVWLIAGQSNAVGYANGLTAAQLRDPRYVNGFDNILYYGYGEKWETGFAPVKLGYGNNSGTAGAELGIAAALGNTAQMNAIIKYAEGATALYPVTDSYAAQNYGTWTSPSYIAEMGISTEGNKTGDLYLNFINTVESAVTELRRMGYTPVIKGMWWMQGEEETYNGGAEVYSELLTYLANDVRGDLTALMGTDMSKMPFVLGKIYTEKRPNLQAGIDKVQSEQNEFVINDPYSAIVNPEACPEYALQDQWHYNAATQSYLGKSFVEKANLINGECIVEIVGTNVSAVGGGLYKNGETVTVTFAPKESYDLKALTLKIGSGDEISILDALSDMSYTFVCNGEGATFTATAKSTYDVETEYGTIPSEYASETDYPVALFGNAFMGVYQNITDAVIKAMQNPNGNYVVLVRSDISQTNGTFISGLTGNILLDLGGNTVTKAASAYILECYYGGGAHNGGKLTVKNGTLVNRGWSAFFCYNYGASLSGNVTFGFEFENVEFRSEYTNEKGKNVIFETWDNGGNTESAIYADVVFNNCIFNYTGAAESEIMLNLTAGATRAIFNVTINGGQIIADTTVGMNEIAKADGVDTVKFGKGTDGYTVCVLVGDATVSTDIFTAVTGGTLSYSDGVYTNNGYAYTLGENVVTEYGTIPYKYTNANTYPFIVFRNGSFVYAATYFGRDNDPSALSNGKVNGTVILMRRDFTYKESQYNNLSQANSITIDLGGYTFTSTDRIVFSAQKKTTNSTSITVKNGTFLLGSQPLMKLASWDPATGGWTPYPGGSGFTFTFENINITLAAGATTKNVLTYNAFSAADPELYCNLTFNNCIFDLCGSANASVTLVDFSDPHCTASAVINGGVIKTAGLVFANLNGANAASTFAFGKSANGYTSLSVSSGNTFDDLLRSYVTKEGIECVFVKASENETTTTYKLYPKVMSDFKIKSSVTLYTNFVYNVYIPTANVAGFTVNGKTMEYTTEVIDGVECYVVKIELPASASLSDIKLTVALNSGSTTVDASWTLSVYSYAKAVLAGEYDNTTKNLMKDMLVYASAAHTYFGNTEAVSEELAEIKALLGDYARELPTGEAKKPEGNTYFTDVAVYLGATPSFRFYLAEGYTREDFTFYVGGRPATVIAGEGYVEIVMYAYMMLDNVSFHVNGTDVVGTYNLYSYYEYAKTLNDANLTAIVEGLMKYAESAKEYRDSVVNK